MNGYATYLGIMFFLIGVIASHRFDLPLSTTVCRMTKSLTLFGISRAVAVYDPCHVVVARLEPKDAQKIDWSRYVRIEEALPRAATRRSDTPILNSADNQRIVMSDHPFGYQSFTEPRLRELRERYDLQQVAAKANNEFEQMVLLRSWTRSQFRRRDYQPLEANFDATEILDRNLRNSDGRLYDPERHFDPCHFFPMLYCQVMLAMGHQARLVSYEHGMAEVWSNQHGKWVLMDAELDLHYERDGIPLNLLELHKAAKERRCDEITVVRGNQNSGDANTTMVHLKMATLTGCGVVGGHKTVDLVEMRNDWWTNHYFPGHPKRSESSTLVWHDNVTEAQRFLSPLRTSVYEERQLYWTLNQAEIHLIGQEQPNRLQLAFRTVTPNFDHFEVRMNDQVPLRLQSSRFRWKLDPGENTLRVSSVNQFGIRGIESRVTIDIGTD